GWDGCLDLAEDGIEDEVCPGSPAPVDRGLVHPGPLGDVADRQVASPAGQQGVERSAQHCGADSRAAATGPAGLGRGCGHRHVTHLTATRLALTSGGCQSYGRET